METGFHVIFFLLGGGELAGVIPGLGTGLEMHGLGNQMS